MLKSGLGYEVILFTQVSEYGRHLAQYFNLFVMYCNLGGRRKPELLLTQVAEYGRHLAQFFNLFVMYCNL
jgi:hypothetical protein